MNNGPYPTWSSFPVLLLCVWLAWECFRFARTRRARVAPAASGWLELTTWFLRPWAAWALFSVVFRVRWQQGFHNVFTFPFYARLWRNGESWAGAAARLFGSGSFWTWSAVSLALSLALCLAVSRIFRPGAEKGARLPLVLLLLLATALPLALGCLPEGPGDAARQDGSLLVPWYGSASTMLYSIPHITSTGHFLRHFEELLPIKASIHATSHPPGASLALYWLGQLFGPSADFRDDRLAYAVSLAAFSSLSVVAIFLLARSLFSSARVGLLAAGLWTAKPALLAHHTFAPDAVYEVFFILALWLIWQVSTAPKRPWAGIAALGATFFALSMLNYSFILPMAMFALMILVRGLRAGWRGPEYLWRGLVPLGIAAALLGLLCLAYRLDYLAVFRIARAYVDNFDRLHGLYQRTASLIGGQLEFFLMLGAVVCSLFFSRVLPAWWRGRAGDGPAFGAIVVALYAATILLGPGPIKMETARCWSWVAAIPVAFVADRILALPRPRFVALGAIALSLGQYYLMRLFVCYLD